MKPVRFGKYTLLERISHGGMAEVFRAKTFGEAGFEREVALKLLLPGVAEDEEFITMLIDEAKIAGQLTHANIAQIFDLGQADGRYYIVQEYVNGLDLRALLKHGDENQPILSIPQACHVLLKMCEGLEYAHNKKDPTGRALNLVHRDISPQNVVISREGEVKLIDFGIAKAEGRATSTLAGLVKGKFAYMSPEQIRGLPVDRRSDVFACGIVLWELLTGKPLFRRKSEFETLKRARSAVIEAPSSVNPTIPQELDAVVLQALARHVEDRYQTSVAFRDALWQVVHKAELFYSRGELSRWVRTLLTGEPDTSVGDADPTPNPDARPDTEDRPRSNLDQTVDALMAPTPLEDLLAQSTELPTPSPDEIVSLLDAAPTPNDLRRIEPEKLRAEDLDALDAPTPPLPETMAAEVAATEPSDDTGGDDDDFGSETIVDPALGARMREGLAKGFDPLAQPTEPTAPEGPSRVAALTAAMDDSDSSLMDMSTNRLLNEGELPAAPSAPYISRGDALASPVDATDGPDPQAHLQTTNPYGGGPPIEDLRTTTPYTGPTPAAARPPGMPSPNSLLPTSLPPHARPTAPVGSVPEAPQNPLMQPQGMPSTPLANAPWGTQPAVNWRPTGPGAAPPMGKNRPPGSPTTERVSPMTFNGKRAPLPKRHRMCIAASLFVLAFAAVFSIVSHVRADGPAPAEQQTASE